MYTLTPTCNTFLLTKLQCATKYAELAEQEIKPLTLFSFNSIFCAPLQTYKATKRSVQLVMLLGNRLVWKHPCCFILLVRKFDDKTPRLTSLILYCHTQGLKYCWPFCLCQKKVLQIYSDVVIQHTEKKSHKIRIITLPQVNYTQDYKICRHFSTSLTFCWQLAVAAVTTYRYFWHHLQIFSV